MRLLISIGLLLALLTGCGGCAVIYATKILHDYSST